MTVIVEFPLTRDQRHAKERLDDAMREFNEAVKFAAKIGLEVEVSLVTAYASYSAKPLNYVSGCVTRLRLSGECRPVNERHS